MQRAQTELSFTELAKRAWKRAPELAREHNHRTVSSAHLLLATLECETDGESRLGQMLLLGGFKREELELYARAWIDDHAPDSLVDETPIEAGEDFTTAWRWAANEANFALDSHVGPEHLFLALLRAQRIEHVGEVLRPLGRDLGFLRESLRNLGAPNSEFAPGHPLGMLGESGALVVDEAHNAMRQTFCGRISTAHLLLGILSTKPNRAIEVLEACEMDVDELATSARATIASDGEIASSTKRFDNGAKRALERAKAEALARGRNRIESEHILVGLLPHRSTWRERRIFGNNVVDPLEDVWENVLANVDEEKLNAALEWRDAPAVSIEALAETEVAPETIRLDWGWLCFGVAWWIWVLLPVSNDVRVGMIGGAFLMGMIAAASGDSLGQRNLTHRASSFVIGLGAGIGVLFLIGGVLVTRG